MRIKRAIIIPAILAFGAAGSVLAGSAMPAAVAAAPSAQALVAGSAHPDMLFHG
jgi:hypothetical protein